MPEHMTDTVMDAEAAAARGDAVGLEMARRGLQDAAATGDKLKDPLAEAPHTHTIFYAKADSLPTAAHIMANGYGELFFHSDDPEAAVAGALGGCRA